MGLYDNYQLTNSQLTKQYAGSSVPALLNVGQVLEGRFDAAREGYDNLGMAIDNSRIHEGDRAMFNSVMTGHRQSITDAAKSGNYEDMMYAANKAGKQFANDYRPFAENYQAIQGYYAEVDKALEKGTLKSPETAEKLKALGMEGYKGLTKDPSTGKLVNKFSGRGIAKEIDVPQKIDEWMKNFAPRVTGGSVEKIEGDYYVTRGGKRTKLSQGEIQNVLKSAMELDPEWNAYKDQKKAIDSMGYDRVNLEAFETDSPMRKRVLEYAEKSGLSMQQAFKALKENAVESELVNHVSNYASKYKRDDVESNYGIQETQEAGRRGQKRLDEQETTFGVPIVIPKTGSEFNTPDKIEEGILSSNKNMKQLGDQHTAWIKQNNVKQVNGKYTLPNGMDVTNTVMRRNLLMEQEKNKRAQLLQLDKEAKDASGYRVSSADIDKAKAAYRNSLFESNGSAPGNVPVSDAQKKTLAQMAYDKALKDLPGYKKYQEELTKRTANMSMETIATRFQNKSDNAAVESMINSMSTSDGDSNLIGMEHVGSQKGGQQFTPDDFEKVKGKITFGGQFMNDKGEQSYIFKATGEKGESIQFQTKGLVSNKSIPQLIGSDAQQFYAQQFLRSATANASKQVTTELSKGTLLKLKVPSHAGDTYQLEIKGNGGGKQWNFDSEDELTSKLSALLNVGR
jgi:hypothetical protein